MVADRPDLEGETYRETLFEAMCEQGYDIGGTEALKGIVDDLVDAVQSIGATLGAGTVVERSGLTMSVRRPGSRAVW